MVQVHPPPPLHYFAIHFIINFMSSEVFAELLPTVSVDVRFRHVPRFESIEFNPELCRDMLVEAGTPVEKIPSVHVHIRPDYPLVYSRRERLGMFLRNPFYDNVSGSTEVDSSGGVLLTIVYGTAYGVNELLRHEALHAAVLASSSSEGAFTPQVLKLAGLLGPTVLGTVIGQAEHSSVPPTVGGAATILAALGMIGVSKRTEQREESHADTLMNDKQAKKKYRNIITIKKHK
jgi:hypothetical protein